MYLEERGKNGEINVHKGIEEDSQTNSNREKHIERKNTKNDPYHK